MYCRYEPRCFRCRHNCDGRPRAHGPWPAPPRFTHETSIRQRYCEAWGKQPWRAVADQLQLEVISLGGRTGDLSLVIYHFTLYPQTHTLSLHNTPRDGSLTCLLVHLISSLCLYPTAITTALQASMDHGHMDHGHSGHDAAQCSMNMLFTWDTNVRNFYNSNHPPFSVTPTEASM